MQEDSPVILIIEDNTHVLRSMVDVLEYQDYRVEGKTTINEACFQQLKVGGYGLIIMDVMLSGNDGRKLLKKIKQTNQTKNIPVIMMSAHSNLQHSILKMGADAFLAKPFDLKELLAKIDHFYISDGAAQL